MTVAQIGWAIQIFVQTSVLVFFLCALVLVAVELAGPLLAERRMGGTPWHAHHIVERYGLLAIIALGEGVVGTVASISAVVGAAGWTMDAALVAVAGTGLTFGLWWVYFLTPHADLLHADRDTSFWFGYLHIMIFGAIVATGAGLHAAAYYIEHHSELGAAATVASVAVPVAVYVVGLYAVAMLVARARDLAGGALVLGALAVLAAAVWLATSGVSMAVCLLVVTLAPVVVVVGQEVIGHRRAAPTAV